MRDPRVLAVKGSLRIPVMTPPRVARRAYYLVTPW